VRQQFKSRVLLSTVTTFIGTSAASEVAKLKARPAWRILAAWQAALRGDATPPR